MLRQMQQPVPSQRPPARRVLVVDADRRVRQGVAGLIELTDDLHLNAAVGDVNAALDRMEADPADVVLLDPSLPDCEAGSALIDRLHLGWPATAIVVMSCSDQIGLAEVQRGGVRFVAKAGDPERLLAALRAT